MAAVDQLPTRIRGAVLAAVLAVVLAAACGAPPVSTPSARPTVTVPPGMPVVISVAGRFDGDELSFLDRQIADFEAANPDARVELVQLKPEPVGRRDELKALLSGPDRESVDILVLDLPWLAEFEAAGWLVPLQSYEGALGIDRTALLTPAVEATTVNGQWVALPWTANAGVLYYRRDLLDKYGYSLADGSANAPLTWAEVQHIAQEVKAGEGLPYGYVWQGAANETLTCTALEFVWAEGGSVLDAQGRPTLDTPATRAALGRMSELIRSGASPAEVAAWGDDESLAAFRRGDAVLMRNWVYAWQRLDSADSPVAGKVGVARLPASCLGGQALGLSAYSLHKEPALRFMAYLATLDGQLQAARDAGLAPVRVDAYHDPELGGSWAELFEALATARPRPQLVPYAALSGAVYEEVHRLLIGQQDPAATAAALQHRAEAAIQR